MLVKAWLEISLDPVQGTDQTRSTYWKRIHDYYHEHKTFESERNINSLSLTVGVSSIKLLIDFVDGILKFRIEEKAG
jgi:hypothetical protein